MKRFLPLPALCGALFATLSAAPSAHAQTPVTTWAQTYGVGTFDRDGTPDTSNNAFGDDLPYCIAPMPDGGVVVGGRLELNKYYSNPYSAQSGGALVRYDRGGAIVWQTLLRQDNDSGSKIAGSTVNFVRTDAGGNIFVAGNNGYVDNPVITPYVAKFAPDGTKIWQTGANFIDYVSSYNADGTPNLFPAPISFLGAMELTDDGGVILGAGNYGKTGGEVYPLIIKLNADGSLGLHRVYYNHNQYSSVRGVCQAVGGQGYAVLLSPEYGSTGVATILLTDAAGNPTSERTLFNPGSGVASVPHFITRDTEGGYFEMNDISQYRTEVRKLRADLTTVWAKLLDYFPGGSPQLAPTLLPLTGGGCLIGGLSSVYSIAETGSTASNSFLLTLDGTGVIVSAHLLGGTVGSGEAGPSLVATGQPLTSCLTTDGGIAFTISTYEYATGSSEKADWWVVKADANGKVIGFPDNMLDYPLSHLTSTDSNEQASTITSTYGPPAPDEHPPFVVSSEPAFILENLATETGINVPTVKFQATPATSYNHVVFFGGEAYLSQGVYYLLFPSGNPFGFYSYLSDPNYIYHYDLGYEYVFDANDTGHGVYLYDFKSNGFFYTSPSFPFPYLYDFSLNSTLYYYPSPNDPDHYNTNGIRYFYVFNTGQIISK